METPPSSTRLRVGRLFGQSSMRGPLCSMILMRYCYKVKVKQGTQHCCCHRVVRRAQGQACMGPRDIPRQVSPHAGLHALHVRRRGADIQHGHSLHAPLEPVQESRLYKLGCVTMHGLFAILSRPLVDIEQLFAAFAPFAPASSSSKSLSTLPLQKIVYLLCNLLTLALGLWKCRSMGLLPTGTGDWLAFETRGQVCAYHTHLYAIFVSDNLPFSLLKSCSYDDYVFSVGLGLFDVVYIPWCVIYWTRSAQVDHRPTRSRLQRKPHASYTMTDPWLVLIDTPQPLQLVQMHTSNVFHLS